MCDIGKAEEFTLLALKQKFYVLYKIFKKFKHKEKYKTKNYP